LTYVVIAEVDTQREMNLHGDRLKVAARLLSDRDGCIKFDVRGKFGEEKRVVSELVSTLLDAGFYEFSIRHSY